MTDADLALFRDLFIIVRNAVVVDGRKIIGGKEEDYFVGDLLRRHLSGEAIVSAYFARPGRIPHPTEGNGYANQLAVSTRGKDPAYSRAVQAELSELGITSYIERTRDRLNVRAFFDEPVSYTLAAMPAWYAASRVGHIFTIRPLFTIHRELEAFGGYLELPLSPGGGCFVDPVTLEPFPDQWLFLRGVVRNPSMVLWGSRPVIVNAWQSRKKFDSLGQPSDGAGSFLSSARQSVRFPRQGFSESYEGIEYAGLRSAHDRIYFGEWRRPGASSIAVRRGYYQIERLLEALHWVVWEIGPRTLRGDVEKATDTLKGIDPENESPEIICAMDSALSFAHRVIDRLLNEKGLPPHDAGNFAHWHIGKVAEKIPG